MLKILNAHQSLACAGIENKKRRVLCKSSPKYLYVFGLLEKYQL